MTTAALKDDLVKRIQAENNVDMLLAIDQLLRGVQNDDPLRDRLVAGAALAEAAIQRGEVFTLEEAQQKAQELLRGLRGGNPTGPAQ